MEGYYVCGFGSIWCKRKDVFKTLKKEITSHQFPVHHFILMNPNPGEELDLDFPGRIQKCRDAHETYDLFVINNYGPDREIQIWHNRYFYKPGVKK